MIRSISLVIIGKVSVCMRTKKLLEEILRIKNPECMEKLAEIASVRAYEKGDLVIRLGEVQPYIYFLLEGVVRCYFLNEEETQITDCFMMEHGWCINMENFDLPSLIATQAVTDVTLLAIPVEQARMLSQDYPELIREYSRILRQNMLFHWRNGKVCIHYPALYRYEWFLKTFPGLDKIANSANIASFLGMTPETLSRTRKAYQNRRKEPGDEREIMVVPGSDWDFYKAREALKNDINPQDYVD